MFAPEQTTEQNWYTWWIISTCKLSLRTRSRISLSVCLFYLIKLPNKKLWDDEMQRKLWGHEDGQQQALTQQTSDGTTHNSPCCFVLYMWIQSTWFQVSFNPNKHLSAGGNAQRMNPHRRNHIGFCGSCSLSVELQRKRRWCRLEEVGVDGWVSQET